MIAAAFLAFNSPMLAQEVISFQSPETRTQVLELFTSQGCSSCPPAEKWLGQFLDYPGLWTEIVPIAFHVDYWDGLGWKDPFASKANTHRQYAYSKAGLIRSVYTPCFVSNGKEWRGFFERTALPMDSSPAGVLKGRLKRNQLMVRYDGEAAPRDLHLLILGCDLETDIRRGENRGRKFAEQFVSLHHSVHPGSSNQWQLMLPDYEKQQDARYALALYLNQGKISTPIQATGTWLP